jgi:hypothetical protein
MGFIVALVGFLGVLAALLWFTGWAEDEVVEPEPLEAKTR